MIEIFGKKCKQIKVIDLLLSHPYIEYTKPEMIEITNIPLKTLDNFLNKLLEYKIIKTTNKIDNMELYQINLDSSITQALDSFQNQIADIIIEKEMKKSGIPPIKPFREIDKELVKTETWDEIMSTNLTLFWNSLTNLPTNVSEKSTFYSFSETSPPETLFQLNPCL